MYTNNHIYTATVGTIKFDSLYKTKNYIKKAMPFILWEAFDNAYFCY